MRIWILLAWALLLTTYNATALPLVRRARLNTPTGKAEWDALFKLKAALEISGDMVNAGRILVNPDGTPLAPGDFKRTDIQNDRGLIPAYIYRPASAADPTTFPEVMNKVFSAVAAAVGTAINNAVAAGTELHNAVNAQPQDSTRVHEAVNAKKSAVTNMKAFFKSAQQGLIYQNQAFLKRFGDNNSKGKSDINLWQSHQAIIFNYRDGMKQILDAYSTNPDRPRDLPLHYLDDFEDPLVIKVFADAAPETQKQVKSLSMDGVKYFEGFEDWTAFTTVLEGFSGSTATFPTGANAIAKPVDRSDCANPRKRSAKMHIARDSCDGTYSLALEGFDFSLESVLALDDLYLDLLSEEDMNPRLVDSEAEALIAIRDLTGDQAILNGVPGDPDADTWEYSVATDEEGELVGPAMYTDAVDLGDAWDMVGDSAHDFVSKGGADSTKLTTAMSAWKRALAARLKAIQNKLRPTRTEKEVSLVQRLAANFDKVIGAVQGAAGANAALDDQGQPLEAFGDFGDFTKSIQQIKSESELEALKQFSIAGVANILPEGMDGLAVIIGSDGAMLDQIDLAGLFDASIAEGSYDASWVAAGDAITEFVSSNSAASALYPMKQSQYTALKRGLRALAKSINKTPGQGGTLRTVFNKISQAVSSIQKSALVKDLDAGSADAADFGTDIPPTARASSTTAVVAALPEMAASDIVTQVWPVESAALAERVIGDASQIIPSHGKTNLARAWKTVVKGIRNQLKRTPAGTQPNVAVQVSANKIKTLYTGIMSTIRGKAPGDIEKDLDQLGTAVSLFNDYNDIGVDALLANAAQYQDPDSGASQTLMNDDLPDDISQMVHAAAVKSEIDTLAILQPFDANILPSNGMDSSQSGSGVFYSGLSKPYRELTPAEVYTPGAWSQAPAAVATDGWNQGITSMLKYMGTFDVKSPEQRDQFNAKILKGLKNMKRMIGLKLAAQKSKSPLDRPDEPAVDLGIHNENFRILVGAVAAQDAPSNGIVEDPLRGQDLNQEDLRSGETVSTAFIVNAFSDASSANPSAILPNGDTAASASDDSSIDPSSLYAGTGSVGEAINSMTSDLNNAISAGSASGTPPTTKASWLRAIRNMKQSKVSMAKIAASGWGKQDLSEIPAIMSALGAADNSENTLETSFKNTLPNSEAGMDNNAAGTSAVEASDVSTEAIASLTTTLENTTSSRGTKNSQLRLRNLRRQLLRRAANGRTPLASRGTNSPTTRPMGPGSGENGGQRGGAGK
ncbi:hypothetical protein HKX48_004363 [Thoreauomyces humboldtii]|nr:hypothetical protein HKX48_004360 [Thoreauomyces humboldtii]KAJ3023069.1 hypothetical protein HKX48_004363 [Thoreauomyces humboldtii]